MPLLNHTNHTKRLRQSFADVAGPAIYNPAARPTIRFNDLRVIDALRDVRLFADNGFVAIPTLIDPLGTGDRALVQYQLQAPLVAVSAAAAAGTVFQAPDPAAGALAVPQKAPAGNAPSVAQTAEIPAAIGLAGGAPFNASGITIRGEAFGF